MISNWKVIYRCLQDSIKSWSVLFFNTEDMAWDFIQSLDSNFEYELPIFVKQKEVV